MDNNLEKSVIGCILGTAVGDSLGLPLEGIPKKRQFKMFPSLEEHHFIFNKGMISDDTEHTIFVAESLLKDLNNPEIFTNELAWKFRFWLLGLPAGIGKATLKACIKLWFGFSPNKSGVFSAGNGPAMRSSLIGVIFRNNFYKMKEFVKASTYITHTDPKAFWGAFCIALAASFASLYKEVNFDDFFKKLKALLGPEADEFFKTIDKVDKSLKKEQTTEQFAQEMGLSRGVSGYIMHTVPIVIHAWLKNPNNYKEALTKVIRCGGDTDTTGAIIGGIMGASLGKKGIPKEWLDNIWEWPKSIKWMEELGKRLSRNCQKIPPFNPLLIIPRNFIFFITVLFHGFRRLFPPY